jgi:hypothetical protein
MKEYPITFTAAEVRAIREGLKTQFRRVIKLRDGSNPDEGDIDLDRHGAVEIMDFSRSYPYWESLTCPYGQPGDRLWVRETWQSFGDSSAITPPVPHACQIRYAADGETLWLPVPNEARGVFPASFKNRNPIHMPRWASRIWLENQSVRVERLQEIAEDGAAAEGITDGGCLSCGMPEPCGCSNPRPDRRDEIARLWGDLWHENPFVWVVTFRVVEGGTND